MLVNIPQTKKKRVVIIGGGFGGLTLARKLDHRYFQVVLLDKNNYHQFRPLLYQVATAGLEPSAISFPFRKVLREKGTHFRMCRAFRIIPDQNLLETSAGTIAYDYLIMAVGSTTNYFGMKNIEDVARPMKSVSEALNLRNTILCKFESAICSGDPSGLNIVVVGGGPTGVEISGALAEMRKYILPKDYPDINFSDMQIILAEAAPRLLSAMSNQASDKALQFLQKMGVNVILNASVKDYADGKIVLADGRFLDTKTVIWTGGITTELPEGIVLPDNLGRGNRLKTDAYNRVIGYERIFAIGDVCLQAETNYPNGHPQMAQPAMQQAKNLAKNLSLHEKGKPMNEFRYFDKGSMATVGRNKAVADLPFIRLQGFWAWVLWMFVHLISILGMKNKMMTMLDWFWSYWTYDPSLRLIIAPKKKKVPKP